MSEQPERPRRLRPRAAIALPNGFTLANLFFGIFAIVAASRGEFDAAARYIVFGAPARNAAGETNTVILTGISPEGSGAYGVYVTASTSRAERASRAKEEEAGRAEERWNFAAPTGEKVELELAFRRGTLVKSHVTARIRSALHAAGFPD